MLFRLVLSGSIITMFILAATGPQYVDISIIYVNEFVYILNQMRFVEHQTAARGK